LLIRRSLLALTAATAVLSVASPALAHVDPDPEEAQAGSQLSVGFTVQHGCDGSPTVQLDMRLPDGVTGAQPEPPTGWTGTVESNVITFTGGPLPDAQELTFRVMMTLPPTPDTTVYFPFVQRCEVGEIRWIGIPSEGSGTDLDEPAPAMRLTGPAVTTTTEAATTTTGAPSTTAAVTTTAPATTLAASSTSAPSETVTATSLADDAGKDSSAGTLVFIGTIAAIVAVASVLVVRSRRRPR
jgi:uncharacterized protein YcnI